MCAGNGKDALERDSDLNIAEKQAISRIQKPSDDLEKCSG